MGHSGNRSSYIQLILNLLVPFFVALSLISCGGGGGGVGGGGIPSTSPGPPEACVCDSDCSDPGATCDPIVGQCRVPICQSDADCPAFNNNIPRVCAAGNCVIPRCFTDEDCSGGEATICTALLQCRLAAVTSFCPFPNQTVIDGECRVDQSSCDQGGNLCGNGVIDDGEACDDGAANSDNAPDACRKDCTLPTCGDGVVDPGNGEVCEADTDCSANETCNIDACDCEAVPIVDADEDGVADEVDNCPNTPNPDQLDSDGDGVGDACDQCEGSDDNNPQDNDGDGLPDVCDPDDDNDSITDADEAIEDDLYSCATDPLDADTDDDSLSDSEERLLGTNPCEADTDGDSLNDADDPFPTDPDLPAPDSDGDGIDDPQDNCPTVPNGGNEAGVPGVGNQDDSDGDGRGDACDNCPETANNSDPDVQTDTDGDGVGDACDNCVDAPNAAQEDGDGDLVGDVCDRCEGSDDALDEDADGLPDDCDACPNDPDNDVDGDGVCGDVDNCPDVSNPGQEIDGQDPDGFGDACDQCQYINDDPDGDGLVGNAGCPAEAFEDNCVNTYNPDQTDSDGDGFGDACDCNLVACGSDADCSADEVCAQAGICMPRIENCSIFSFICSYTCGFICEDLSTQYGSRECGLLSCQPDETSPSGDLCR